jgi:hypothetical protein
MPATAAATAGGGGTNTHTLHELLFQLGDDVRKRSARQSYVVVDNDKEDRDLSQDDDEEADKGNNQGKEGALCSDLLKLLRSERGAGRRAKRKRTSRNDDDANATEFERTAKLQEETNGTDDRSYNRYHRMREECQREESQHLMFHREQLQKFNDVRAVYLFGLQKVSALQDLREAPDAILPGNFPNKSCIGGGGGRK